MSPAAAVEIAEILARNYVKTIQLDLESSGEIFMYLLVKCRELNFCGNW